MDIILKIAAVLGGVIVVMGIVPAVTWALRIRVCIAVLLGMVLLGIYSWPLVAPAGPFDIVTTPPGAPAALVVALAAAAGFVGYFLTWPQGRYIAPIVVPAGLGVWAVRTAPMADALAGVSAAEQRVDLIRSLIPGAFFWLLLIAAGVLGIILAQTLLRPGRPEQSKTDLTRPRFQNPFNIILTVVVSSSVGYLLVTLLAQNVKLPDVQVGEVIAQPSAGQIGFAAFTAFLAASFVARKFLNCSYYWVIISVVLVSITGLAFNTRVEVMEYLAANWPSNFFAGPHAAILPIQMVSFGTLGAISGFWLVESYEIWRHPEEQEDG